MKRSNRTCSMANRGGLQGPGLWHGDWASAGSPRPAARRCAAALSARPKRSLAGGATAGPAGEVYFAWTAYARRELSTRPVSIYVSRSSDAGQSWNTVLLDVSSAAPECEAQGCEAGYLGAQIALASDAAGTVYARVLKFRRLIRCCLRSLRRTFRGRGAKAVLRRCVLSRH